MLFKRNPRTTPLARQARVFRFVLVLILLSLFIITLLVDLNMM